MTPTTNLGLPIYGANDVPRWDDTNAGFQKLEEKCYPTKHTINNIPTYGDIANYVVNQFGAQITKDTVVVLVNGLVFHLARTNPITFENIHYNDNVDSMFVCMMQAGTTGHYRQFQINSTNAGGMQSYDSTQYSSYVEVYL